ncbi:hypothetical protein TNCV_947051 [Trichonephila clavipes]|nr:hypothetical protein TNCV_947051 [Trichonephila clavipes]
MSCSRCVLPKEKFQPTSARKIKLVVMMGHKFGSTGRTHGTILEEEQACNVSSTVVPNILLTDSRFKTEMVIPFALNPDPQDHSQQANLNEKLHSHPSK